MFRTSLVGLMCVGRVNAGSLVGKVCTVDQLVRQGLYAREDIGYDLGRERLAFVTPKLNRWPDGNGGQA